MALSIDNLAHRYHCLPSHVLANATTFDLYILDLSAKWNRYQSDIASGATVDHRLTKEEMLGMINRVRREK